MASAGPRDPGSWNRYSYTRGDPVNRRDPRGTCDEDTAYSVNVCDTVVDIDTFSYPGASGGGGGWGTTAYFNGEITSAIAALMSGVGASLGSTAQNAFVLGNGSFALASAALAGDLGDLTTFQGTPLCEADLAAVSQETKVPITDAIVQNAAGSANIINGLTSLTNYANDVYGNSPAAGAAAFAFGPMMMAQYMSLNPNTAAVAQAPGNNIYIDAGWINGMTATQQTAMLLHEFFHNITGGSDSVIQSALGLDTNAPSQNIGDKLQRDCFR